MISHPIVPKPSKDLLWDLLPCLYVVRNVSKVVKDENLETLKNPCDKYLSS